MRLYGPICLVLALLLTGCPDSTGPTTSTSGATGPTPGGGTGTGGGTDPGGGTTDTTPTTPPAAIAKGAPEVTLGPDLAEREGNTVTLQALSVDNNGSITSVAFTQTAGPAATFNRSAGSNSLDVTLPAATGPDEVVTFRVTVTDNDGLTATDETDIALLQSAPVVTSQVRAGVAVFDATGPLGGSAGQYADITCDFEPDPNACSGNGRVFPDDFDPSAFSTGKKGAYGLHTRITVRALVIEGNNGKRVALLKSDNYLAQDMLQRRVAQILNAGSSGIGYEQILHSASHAHSSPYQLTQAAGVWVFQDQFSEIAFERMAQAMAAAIESAAADLRPVRLSATTVEHNIVKANITRGAIAVDGTPAGYPVDYGDTGLVVMRVDDVSVTPPRPLAYWMNHGQHPESLDGYHLISADFLAPLERFVERELGAPLLMTQGDVGSAEGPYAGDAEFLEGRYEGVWTGFAHEGYSQLERQGRILADAVADANGLIEAQDDVDIPWTEDFAVDWFDYFIPGPLSHPTPTVSNCDANQTYEGNLGIPAAGLPDCERTGDSTLPSIGSVLAAGAPLGTPVPGQFSAPGHPAVEENQRIHLQAMRLGEILLASCACEPQVDLILNLESRADKVQGNIYDGYDWAQFCSQNPDTTWDCPNPRNQAERLLPIDDADFQRMVAQVHNDAVGWDSELFETTEPNDPAQIKGNFTKEELPANLGYDLVVGMGHTGDYNGYTVSYREYQSRDHYRKALTAYGPHTADYMVTRLVRMGGALKGGPAVVPEPHQSQADADEARQESQAQQLGQQSSANTAAFDASLPPDPGVAEILTQPADTEHFSAALIEWRGGNNGVDNPTVRVEKRDLSDEGNDWQPVADMSGEVQSRLVFPGDQAELTAARAGQFEWVFQAGFEAFPAFPLNVGSTEFGEYRFVITGRRQLNGMSEDYVLISDPFLVTPWQGIQVDDIQVDVNGDVSFVIPPIVYPRSYESPFFVIGDDEDEVNCETCSFRAWARDAEVEHVQVTVTRADDTVETVPATLSSGRWFAETDLQSGDIARLAPGDIIDAHGEINAGVDIP